MKANILFLLSGLLLIPSCIGTSFERSEIKLDEPNNYHYEPRPPVSRRKTVRTVTTHHHVVKTTGTVPFNPSAPLMDQVELETSDLSAQCREAGYISDPTDCNKFYSCVQTAKENFTVIPLSCATGTMFDPVKSKCRSRGICSTNYNKGTQEFVHAPPTLPNMPEAEQEHSLEALSAEPEWSEIPNLSVHPEFESEMDSLNNYQPSTTDERPIDPEEAHLVVIREVESMEEYEPIVLEQLQSRSKSSDSTKPRLVSTTHASPNAWFGLVRTNPNKSPGNPFSEQETSLAIILDFSTSRLQIFSKNVPKKALRK